MAERYNYRRFRATDYDFESFPGPEPGEPFPEFQAWTPEGETVRREDLLGSPTVLETGSITCSIYAGHIEAMRRLRDRYRDVDFAVLYVREAHPGNGIGPHTELAEKRRRARQLRTAEGEDRDILVDGIDGDLHERIGPFPHLVYVLDEDARVVYRAEWNDPQAVETVLDHLSRGEPVPWVEPQLGNPPASLGEVLRVTWRAGPDALWDLLRAVPRLLSKRGDLEERWRRRAREATPVEPGPPAATAADTDRPGDLDRDKS